MLYYLIEGRKEENKIERERVRVREEVKENLSIFFLLFAS